MIGFDPDICELCGGFGDCADGDCEDKTQKGQDDEAQDICLRAL